MGNEIQTENLVPRSPSFLTLVTKTFAGLGGGIIGVVILLAIFLGASTILQPAFNPQELGEEVASKNPLFIFVFMAMIFLTSLAANMIGSLFFTYADHEKYSRRSTAIYQIFFINLVTFFILAPIYILLDARGMMNVVGFLAGFHVLITATASAMVLEVIGNLRYALVGIYGVILSVVSSTAVIMGMYELSGHNVTIVLFSTLPVVWMALGFVSVISEMFYHWIWTIYGTDFLRSTMDYGRDYGEPEVEDTPPPPDVSGAEFLEKK
ncbi:hypothetical protein KBD59_01980 [Candidatus Gracilibacteria bacterium]|nr:hypothetical protein [Candidatus Gracilibacteria bacterium]